MSVKHVCSNTYMGIVKSKCGECKRRQAAAKIKPVHCLKCGEIVLTPTCLYTRMHFDCVRNNDRLYVPTQYRIGNSELSTGSERK